MGATQILNALPGEDLIGIEPELSQQGQAGWLERLALFTGRTLSDTALINEQTYRAGRFTLLGQAVTQGVVQGLDLSVDLTVPDPALSVAPGYGISATGQDVTLLRTMKTTLSGLAVIDGVTGAYIADFGKFTPPVSQPWAGVLLLQAILADVPGSAVDSGAGNIIVSGNLDASCDQDPTEYAFGDSQVVDGTRLVFVTWPSTIAMPAAAPSSNWRNRLVYTIFNAELALAQDDRLPWEFLGVPLALAGFDATSKLLFADRSAVVRAGGMPRRRYVVPYQDGQQNLMIVQPALANARVNQLAEQLGEDLSPTSPPGLVASEFALLPPTGVLPAYTMDFIHKVASWCPSNWLVTAAPVYTEELEGVLQGAITAAPLDTTQSEAIEILVPLPDEVYDPEILVTEVVAAVFQQEVNAATDVRNGVLRHRKVIELEANALASVSAQPQLDISAGLTADEITARDGTPVYTPAADETFATVLSNGVYVSVDYQHLQIAGNAPPYTVTVGSTQLPLFSTDDWADLTTNGLQHFINLINAKLQRANDLLDLGFLTSQTDIYRYRQSVLNTTDAARLAVSPILANIASGDTAAATAQNIQDYLSSVGTKPPTTGSGTTTTPPPTTTPGPVLESRPIQIRTNAVIRSPALLTKQVATTKTAAATTNLKATTVNVKEIAATTATVKEVAATATRISAVNATGVFNPIVVGSPGTPATPVDITQQSPIVGAQLNLRTLTIAERLSQSQGQEALFYSVGNRVSLMQLLADLEITIDDIPILADNVPSTTTPPLTMADLRLTANAAYSRPAADPVRTALALSLVNNPQIDTPLSTTNPDEAALFSVGIHVLEQHTQMMRAVEARIQQYQDFLALCSNALANIQTNLQSAQTLLNQLGNDLTQSRQNLAFVLALLADEKARVAAVNATRISVLGTYVHFIAFTRSRTVVNQPNTQSRQLVPAAVSNPVPACLQQSLSIPPELREMVALLREAPVSWFPLVVSQLPKLERPSLLQELASDTQARANMVLASPLHVSSAAASSGIFASTIANTYSAGQQAFRTLQTQRAAFQPASLVNQSWASQIATLSGIVAVGDLQASDAVHAEVAGAASRAMQEISSVATCLYTRVGQALPVDRLVWAQFLQGSPSVSLQSLAVLPGWNSQNYIDRQQMQLLVDWLFQQLDARDPAASALMNDLVAVAILLASDAPVDGIIAGAVALRTRPVVGGPIRLTLPSNRVAHGMYVNLYSAGNLAARGVVSDLDTSGVTATITDIYIPNVSLEANDIAHYTARSPNAVVYKAFSD